jgi:hypothetical protein
MSINRLGVVGLDRMDYEFVYIILEMQYVNNINQKHTFLKYQYVHKIFIVLIFMH